MKWIYAFFSLFKKISVAMNCPDRNEHLEFTPQKCKWFMDRHHCQV